MKAVLLALGLVMVTTTAHAAIKPAANKCVCPSFGSSYIGIFGVYFASYPLEARCSCVDQGAIPGFIECKPVVPCEEGENLVIDQSVSGSTSWQCNTACVPAAQ